MIKPALRICAVLFFIIGAVPGQAQDAAKPETAGSVVLGGRAVILPAPEGFVRVDGVFAEWDDAIQKILPPGNRLLAKFGSAQDLAELKQSKAPESEVDFNVQILRKFESQEVGTRTFADIRAGIVKEMGAAMKAVESELGKVEGRANDMLDKKGVASKLSFGKPVVLGVFADNDREVGFSMLLSMQVDGAAEKPEDVSVVACLITPVNGRLLYLYHTLPYKAEPDQKTAESGVLKWAHAVASANPTVEGPSGKKFGGIFNGSVRAAGIGAGVGLVIYLLNYFKKRKAEKSVGGPPPLT